ncbi:site-specific DNA methylase [Cenarchaeum symbiosum A]|uniref:site-specific DNA-methyltransferase (adenine-specific) n=1 Tax=Cenarchaeum symbiosum (strain A) TaxID=414004 RepID=A0RV94_CENSY|nr:site-specific DNA methylase [Cenarchaeum symbiosum A]
MQSTIPQSGPVRAAQPRIIPPIKIQGIKSKLVPFIRENARWDGKGRWFEPFLGSGVVLFNIQPGRAAASDHNPHIAGFYQGISRGTITHHAVRRYLEKEGQRLAKEGGAYYYEIRDRFNSSHDPLDFLFLNRAGFNGLVRFNSKGGYNTPFCKKPGRFSKAYITKIVNQVYAVERLIRDNKWCFETADWRGALEGMRDNDFAYLDPPYYGRHANYYDTWSESDMADLAGFLIDRGTRFALSLWYENKYRRNDTIDRYFSGFAIHKHEHFYHLGSTENLRNSMVEALITG